MKHPFDIGSVREYTHVVSEADIASFKAGTVHPVYATFSLARDAEWSGRLFVLDMKEADEEGIGTGLTIEHLSPALLGQTVIFTTTLTEVNGNEVVTSYVATVGKRVIARGKQWQKILKKEKIEHLFAALHHQSED